MTGKLSITALAVAGLLAGAPAMAQNVNANNLVSVNLQQVEVEIAEDLGVNVSNIPVSVQVPIGIAANVCDAVDADANVLAQQKKNEEGGATCDATSTSTALNKVVQRQMTDQSS